MASSIRCIDGIVSVPTLKTHPAFYLLRLTRLAALGVTNTIAAFQLYVSTHQLSQYSEGSIGWIFSLYTFLAFFCGVYIGPVFDKFGPRWLILVGSVCIGASLMLLSVCKGILAHATNTHQYSSFDSPLTSSLPSQNTGTSSLSLEYATASAARSSSPHALQPWATPSARVEALLLASLVLVAR